MQAVSLADAYLDIVDMLVGDGKAVYCEVMHPDEVLSNETLIELGFESYADLPLFRPRRPFEKSLWLRRQDGRCMPELYALAIIKDGPALFRKHAQPYWTDKNWRNNVAENVSLDIREVKDSSPMSKYGVRSGTVEYTRRYYEANKEKQRKHSRDYARRRRAALRQAKEALKREDHPLQELRDRIMGPDERKLEDDERKGFARGE